MLWGILDRNSTRSWDSGFLEPSGITDSTSKNFPDFGIQFRLYREIYKVSREPRFSGLVEVLNLRNFVFYFSRGWTRIST